MQTRPFLLFAATGFVELGALLALGQSTISLKGLAVIVALVLWLGRGSRIAWWLFVSANALTLLSTLPMAIGSPVAGSSGRIIWGNLIVLSLGSATLLAILFSPAMRSRQPLRA